MTNPSCVMPALQMAAFRSHSPSQLSSLKVSLGKEKKAHPEAQVYKQSIFVLNDASTSNQHASHILFHNERNKASAT